MAESQVDATEPLAQDDELVVRVARVVRVLLFLFAVAYLSFGFIVIWLYPRPHDTGFYCVVELGFVAIMTTLALICLIGTFLSLPLFSVSHAGIRTYSLFGLFGSELMPWSEVMTIRIDLLIFGPRALKIFSLNRGQHIETCFLYATFSTDLASGWVPGLTETPKGRLKGAERRRSYSRMSPSMPTRDTPIDDSHQ